MEKFPDKIYAVFDINGQVYFFADINSCPVVYRDSIRAAVYKIDRFGLIKSSKATFESINGEENG